MFPSLRTKALVDDEDRVGGFGDKMRKRRREDGPGGVGGLEGVLGPTHEHVDGLPSLRGEVSSHQNVRVVRYCEVRVEVDLFGKKAGALLPFLVELAKELGTVFFGWVAIH